MEKYENEQPHPRGVFATTRWSIVLAASQRDSAEGQKALETLCGSYWQPVHSFIRKTIRNPETARDLTQAFFAKLLAKDLLQSADQKKGRFRTYLLTMAQRFLADQHDYQTAQKRGRDYQIVSIDELAEQHIPVFVPSNSWPFEREFDREWALAVLEKAMERLKCEAAGAGQGELFACLNEFLSGGESTESLGAIAQRLGLGHSAVKMRLHRWRARYRALIREEVAETVPRLADVEEEMRHLLLALGK